VLIRLYVIGFDGVSPETWCVYVLSMYVRKSAIGKPAIGISDAGYNVNVDSYSTGHY